MPFGLCNAPATFQRTMNEIFGDLIGKVLHVYVDDVTIYTKTFDEHMAVLDEVLNRIKAAGMSIKPKKCTIAAEELHMLGHIIGKDGIKTDPAKIEAVTQYPVPTSKTEVRAFMGLVGYYRHFIKNCSAIAQPINATLKKDKHYNWTDKAQQAFEKLKILLTTAPVLARPDLNKTFRLHTDACKTGLGAVLTQDFEIPGKLDRRGKPLIRERVIAYASRGYHGAESKYGATQLEQLAVVEEEISVKTQYNSGSEGWATFGDLGQIFVGTLLGSVMFTCDVFFEFVACLGGLDPVATQWLI